tara:strand:- start:699 stop:893 length:195 start_codon:yes stop_codon:yes gene_type:complete
MINFVRKGESMASIGEHLQAVAQQASALIKRVEKEPLNVADYIDSSEFKATRDYINKIADRTIS